MRLRILPVLCCTGLLLAGCSEEQQNRLSRIGVTWLEGDYRITYADGNHVKSWTVRDGKGTYYMQTPIARSYIEEIKD